MSFFDKVKAVAKEKVEMATKAAEEKAGSITADSVLNAVGNTALGGIAHKLVDVATVTSAERAERDQKKDQEREEANNKFFDDMLSGDVGIAILEDAIKNSSGETKKIHIESLRIEKLKFGHCPQCETKNIIQENKDLINAYNKSKSTGGLQRHEEWEADFKCKNCNYSSHESYIKIIDL